MKKLLIIVITILLTGCDYSEKSLQALSERDIPKEVTMDFEVPRGIYGAIIYESSNDDVLKVSSYNIEVFQQEDDVEVTLTARVNSRLLNFRIKVLKIGSNPTPLEKVRIAFSKLEFNEVVEEDFYLPAMIDGIEFFYTKPLDNRYLNYEINEKENDQYLVTITRGVKEELIAFNIKCVLMEENNIIEERYFYISGKIKALA